MPPYRLLPLDRKVSKDSSVLETFFFPFKILPMPRILRSDSYCDRFVCTLLSEMSWIEILTVAFAGNQLHSMECSFDFSPRT